MKKSLFLLPLLAISLAACGGKGGSGGGDTLIATYDFTGLQDTNSSLDSDPAAKLGSLGTAITWTSATKVFSGGGTGGAKENSPGLLKFGTSSAQGILSFTVSENVSRIVLNCHSFYAPNSTHPTNITNYVSVNEMTPIAAPYNATATGEDVTFDLSPATNTISIKSCNADGSNFGRIYLYSLSLYK